MYQTFRYHNIFDFIQLKNITTAEGGCVLTNDKKLYNLITNLRSHGINRNIVNSKTNKIKFKNEPWFYEILEISENYRLSDLQCSLGISQLQKLEKFKRKRKQFINIMIKKLKS